MIFRSIFSTLFIVVTLGTMIFTASMVVDIFGKPAPYYISHNNGWVWAHSYKEEDDCVGWSGGKVCGDYAIKDYR